MLRQGTCCQCGIPIQFEYYASRSHANRFCSLSCSARHTFLGRRGPDHHLWKGGRSYDKNGYVILNGLGRKRPVQEHIYVAEKALGRPLPARAQVHHVNEIKDDNRNSNLVICQDQGYHSLLHRLSRVRIAGGNPFTDKLCWMCQRALPIGNFGQEGRASACRACRAMRARVSRNRDVHGKETKRRSS